MDDDHHRRATGSSNREILDNLRRLARGGAAVRIRVPVIPGFNDDVGHLSRLAAFVTSLGFSEIDLLPYRGVSAGRYEALGRANPSAGTTEPSADALSAVCDMMAAHGLRAAVVERPPILR